MDVAGDDRVVLLESGRNGSEENGFCVGWQMRGRGTYGFLVI
jgi:hypothetical protein